jgi:uncharacterized protein YbbC (DUF1343 family)
MKLIIAALLLCSCLSARVKTGLDVLVEQDFAPIAGKRVGVIANQNSRTWDNRSIATVLANSPKVKLTAIFAPEHGFSGASQAGATIESGKDAATGVQI